MSDFEKALAHGLELHQNELWSEAVRHWDEMIRDHPNRPRPRQLKGRALMASGALDDAETCFQDLISGYPNAPEGYIGRAELCAARHRWHEAITCFRDLASRFPEHRAAYVGWARALLKIGDADEARSVLSGARQRFGNYPAADLLLGKLNAVRKVDAINLLIRHFGLTHYLEYNKYLCELSIHEVNAPSKSIAYIPEEIPEDAVQDSALERDALAAGAAYTSELVLGLPELLKRFARESFDIIFFDPLHFRPEVDRAIKALTTLLQPDGFLVVHDCNPTNAIEATKERHSGAWCGETYKAFANFHQHNPDRAITIDEDYGIGIILNRDLCLDYTDNFDLDYESFAANRATYNGLIDYDTFCARLVSGNRVALFEDPGNA